MKLWKVSISYILFLTLFLQLSYPFTLSAKEKSKYHIKVNRQTNSLTIYELQEGKYQPIKAMLCSTGGRKTPLGTFSTSQKMKWHNLFQNLYGQYVTRITGHYLFHSLPYTKKNPGTLLPDTFHKLGTSASAGCVRLSVADSKWIHTHCPLGTKVTIYESKDPGPLGKPEPHPFEKENGFDPSDIWSDENPILKKEPVITVDGDLIVNPTDSEVNLLKGVKATSFQGHDITDKITIKDNINYSKPGKYKITYKVKDILKKKASFTRTVVVK